RGALADPHASHPPGVARLPGRRACRRGRAALRGELRLAPAHRALEISRCLSARIPRRGLARSPHPLKILGLSAFYHDSAAALLVDGRIVAAAQEERFTRTKHDHRFPSQAIEYCL